MMDILMTLGDGQVQFIFSIDTAAYQSLQRRTEWRWPAQERLWNDPARQFTGRGNDEITMDGVILPAYRGGLGQIAAMREMADAALRDGSIARPLLLVTGYGDVLGEAAESNVEFLAYRYILAASDNDAYNTLVATDIAPDFGRDAIWQVAREKDDRPRHSLPNQLGGQGFAEGRTLAQLNGMIADGWVFRTTRLTEEYTLEKWREARPGAVPLATLDGGDIRFLRRAEDLTDRAGRRIVSLIPPELAARIRDELADLKKELRQMRQAGHA